jgi:hypothetical protein
MLKNPKWKRSEAMIGNGRPEGEVRGNIDELYLDRDHASVWVKVADPGKKTGWQCIGQLVGTASVTPARFAAAPASRR